jgi:hypothetical protein
MIIKTKFDVGQMVWIMFNNQPEQWRIEKICLPDVTKNTPPTPRYDLVFTGSDHCGSVHNTSLWEYQVHATKRELLMSFLTDND